MNVTVYLFGKLGGSYTQYPDDYSREVFSEFEKNIKSPAQLMIHRHEALIYYGYLRRLSVQDKYRTLLCVKYVRAELAIRRLDTEMAYQKLDHYDAETEHKLEDLNESIAYYDELIEKLNNVL